MDSGKLFIEKINFCIYIFILLIAVLNRFFGFFNPYAYEVNKITGVGYSFYLMTLYALWSHLISLIMAVVGLVLTLKRSIEKETTKNSFRLVAFGTVHTLFVFATVMVIVPEFIAIT
ncbi:MAG: hypothetical protein J6A07_04580 [Firmicutes bacterium]|nr:hypothetical protein [Bacillota bacterium]